MQWLKQSTAATVKLGPFVDDTDGKTAETGLTISQADIRISKNGGAFAQTNNATGATHDENGYYGIPLDTTDTGTLGRLRVSVSESGALPVWQDFMVVPANVYDSVVGGSDYLQTDAVEISGDSTAADNAELAFDGTGYGFTNCTVPTVTTLTGHTAQTGDSYAIVNGDHGLVSIQDDVDAIKTKTDYLPSATAGAAGGVFIAGTNAPVTITGDGDALTVSSTGSNGNGVSITGHGNGDGMEITSGGGLANAALRVVGDGLGTNHALVCSATEVDGIGILVTGSDCGIDVSGTAGPGIDIEGYAQGVKITADNYEGLKVTGGSTGEGYGRPAVYLTSSYGEYGTLRIEGPASGGCGVLITSQSEDAALSITNTDTGKDIDASEIDAILADTNELQGDLANGGRLDLLIDSIVTYVDCLPATLDGSTFTSLPDVTLADGAHGGASASLTLSDYSDFQATSVTVSDKTGFKLASDGLDSISTTEPDGLPDNFRERLLWLYRRLFKKTVRTATKINHYDDAGTSILLEQDISDSAGTETMGEAEEPT